MFGLLLLSGIIRGIGYVVAKYISLGKGSAHAMALATTIVDTILCIPILIYFLTQAQGMRIEIGIALLAIISAATYGISLIFQYGALKKIDISIMGIILRLSILFSSLIGVFVLGENLNTWNYLGLVAILLGNIIVLWNKGKFDFNLGIIFTIAAAICSAIASNMDKFILTKVNSVLYVFINSLLITLTLFVMSPKSLKESIVMIRSRTWVFVAMSALTVLSFLAGSYVLQNMDVSKYVPVQKTITLIIPVLFGIFFFQEKQHLQRKFIGLMCAILGIALMYV